MEFEGGSTSCRWQINDLLAGWNDAATLCSQSMLSAALAVKRLTQSSVSRPSSRSRISTGWLYTHRHSLMLNHRAGMLIRPRIRREWEQSQEGWDQQRLRQRRLCEAEKMSTRRTRTSFITLNIPHIFADGTKLRTIFLINHSSRQSQTQNYSWLISAAVNTTVIKSVHYRAGHEAKVQENGECHHSLCPCLEHSAGGHNDFDLSHCQCSANVSKPGSSESHIRTSSSKPAVTDWLSLTLK